MPDLTLTLTVANMTRLVDALCAVHDYQATLDDGSANPETRPQFAKRMLIQRIKGIVRGYEGQKARDAMPAIADLPIT